MSINSIRLVQHAKQLLNNNRPRQQGAGDVNAPPNTNPPLPIVPGPLEAGPPRTRPNPHGTGGRNIPI